MKRNVVKKLRNIAARLREGGNVGDLADEIEILVAEELQITQGLEESPAAWYRLNMQTK